MPREAETVGSKDDAAVDDGIISDYGFIKNIDTGVYSTVVSDFHPVTDVNVWINNTIVANRCPGPYI